MKVKMKPVDVKPNTYIGIINDLNGEEIVGNF